MCIRVYIITYVLYEVLSATVVILLLSLSLLLCTSRVPSNPVAARTAHRIAFTPSKRLLSNDSSALHVRISPREPGPSSRPSGWTAGPRSWRVFCNLAIFDAEIPDLAAFLSLTSSLSTFERMI